MALDQYTNSNQILNITEPTEGIRYSTLDLDLLRMNPVLSLIDPKATDNNYATEFHVYTPEGSWVTSDYRLKYISKPSGQTCVQINLLNSFQQLGILRGEFKFVVNIHHNWIGNQSNEPLFIKEISPDRDEVHLLPASKLGQLDDPTDPDQSVEDSINEFKQVINSISNETNLSYFALNFGRNQIAKITNIWFDGNNIFIKLYEPLPDNIVEKQRSMDCI